MESGDRLVSNDRMTKNYVTLYKFASWLLLFTNSTDEIINSALGFVRLRYLKMNPLYLPIFSILFSLFLEVLVLPI